MATQFLPEGYELPATGGRFFKPEAGENRIRILGPAITGTVRWGIKDGKKHPYHVPPKAAFPEGLQWDPKQKPREFWAVPIWDYRAGAVKLWEITQNTIQTAIMTLYSDSDWGSPEAYDLKINKKGDGMETEYSVVASPKKPLPVDAQNAWDDVQASGFDINALYAGNDPFGDGSGNDSDIPF